MKRHIFLVILAITGLALSIGCNAPKIPKALVPMPAPTPLNTAAPILPATDSYEIGTPTLTDLWVDPVKGSDENDGTTRAHAFRTLRAAWRSIPQGTLNSTGYRIRLLPGTHAGGYLESRYGTLQFPILIEPADGAGTATLGPTGNDGGHLTLFDSRHVYLQDFRIAVSGGDAFHCERCDHVLLRRMTISSRRSEAQDETVKVNQSQYIYIENSDISGAGDNNIDFVAVQYGHIVNNRIHNAQDWCMYVKGGSAYLRVEGNEIYDCGTGGFTAGQGTGFEFMTPPWLHYEAYDIKFYNNVIRDTDGAGMGVNGGFNILLAYNTLYRVGKRSHVLEVVFGLRGCDGETARCSQYQAAGGWGPKTVGIEEPIPNRNIYIYNNIVYNPSGYQSQWQHFMIAGARKPSVGSNIPSPTSADSNLQIRGNLIWNGPRDHQLGIEDADQGCQPANPTCNATQLRADNAINTFEPQLTKPASGDFHPTPGGNVFSAKTFVIPPFNWSDAPPRPGAPSGNPNNAVTRDRNSTPRRASSPPGTYIGD